MSVATDALESARNKLLHELEEYDRPDVRRLSEASQEAQRAAAAALTRLQAAGEIVAQKEAQVKELNEAIHRLNGTRAIADRPQA